MSECNKATLEEWLYCFFTCNFFMCNNLFCFFHVNSGVYIYIFLATCCYNCGGNCPKLHFNITSVEYLQNNISFLSIRQFKNARHRYICFQPFLLLVNFVLCCLRRGAFRKKWNQTQTNPLTFFKASKEDFF